MSKRRRQSAPPPAKPTRKVSDVLLSRMLDPHMVDSLGDISVLYQRLASLLGYRSFKYEARVHVQSIATAADRAVDTAVILGKWKTKCEHLKLRSKVVTLIASDGMSVTSVMRILRMRRECVRAHLRACLAVWSFLSKRCGWLEVQGLKKIIRGCCGPRKANKTATM
jgi:hypothetical protein